MPISTHINIVVPSKGQFHEAIALAEKVAVFLQWIGASHEISLKLPGLAGSGGDDETLIRKWFAEIRP